MKHESHRRPNSQRRNLCQEGENPAGLRQVRGGRGGHAGRTYPALACPATGLLIPRLHEEIPTSYSGQLKGIDHHLQALLDFGAVKAETEGEDAEELVHIGIESLIPTGLLQYEESFGGEWVRIYVNDDADDGVYHLHIEQHCHQWIMRVKPIVRSLPDDEAFDFVKRLDKTAVQGPWFWSEMIGFARDDDDAQHLFFLPDGPQGDAKEWLKNLRADEPCFGGRQKLLVDILLPLVPNPTPPELRPLIEEFFEAYRLAAPYGGRDAIMVTSWDKDCHVNHGHDTLDYQIREGMWENQEGEAFLFSAKTIAELKTGLDAIGRFVAAATKLEEWSNAHC